MGVYLEQINRVTRDKRFENQVATNRRRPTLALARPTGMPVAFGSLVSSIGLWQFVSNWSNQHYLPHWTGQTPKASGRLASTTLTRQLACCCCNWAKTSSKSWGSLGKLRKAPTTQHSHPEVRHLVGVWLSSSTIQYTAAVGQKLLAAASSSNTNLSSAPTSLGRSRHRHRYIGKPCRKGA